MAYKLRDFFWIVLLPVSWVYSAVASWVIRLKSSQEEFSVPVISIGNLSSGGTGKTPLVIEVAQHFSKLNPAILSRGYKSQSSRRGAHVDLRNPKGPELFGDEPWMMAQLTGKDVYVGANRKALFSRFQMAQKHGLVILDDGYQHTQMNRSLNILVVSGEQGPSDAHVIPLGNLREPLSAMRRAHGVVITTGQSQSNSVQEWLSLAQQLAPNTPCFIAQRVFDGPIDENECPVKLESYDWGGFSGIGNSERFVKDVKAWGATRYFITFSDHHAYTREDIRQIVNAGKQSGVTAYLTTAKDFYKVAEFFKELQEPMFMARSHYELPKEFWHWIDQGVSPTC